uniref:Uncharacterized protein n=1 Tax=Anguilla anguilla TaxID=7936 RepID=A0A0E9STV4_ANGAN
MLILNLKLPFTISIIVLGYITSVILRAIYVYKNQTNN